MASRQRSYQLRHKEQGLCSSCPRPRMSTGTKCLRCVLVERLTKARVGSYVRKRAADFNRLVAALEGRYYRIVNEEGFAVDALDQPKQLVDGLGFEWARGRALEKILKIIAAMDDRAIRERFRHGG